MAAMGHGAAMGHTPTTSNGTSNGISNGTDQQWDTHILIDMERSDGVGFARTQTKGID
jgi:hypothetical protein